MDTVRRSNNGIAWTRSPKSSVCVRQFTTRLAPESLTHWSGYRTLQSGGRFLPRQADIDARPTVRNAFTFPSVASALLSKHRPRCSEIGRSRSWINLVMSTSKLRSGNCVKKKASSEKGRPILHNQCHFPNSTLCRCLSVLSWCALLGPRCPISQINRMQVSWSSHFSCPCTSRGTESRPCSRPHPQSSLGPRGARRTRPG